jgi:uncharacterized UPF0146 family protein
LHSAGLPEEFVDFVNYIINTYSGASKIVEVGVGRFCAVAAEIKHLLPNTEVIVTDSDITAINEANRKYSSLKVVKDDVEKPNIKLYRNADIIYSIRAPPELWPKIVHLSELIHSNLIIFPLPTETPVTIHGFRLVNFGRARFYLKERYTQS